MSVNLEEVEQFRTSLFNEIDEKSDAYYQEDIERLRNDDWYCQRYILHTRNNLEKAIKMAKEDVRWRKEFGVKEITQESIPKRLRDLDCAYAAGKDKWGRILMVLEVKKIVKTDAEEELGMRKYIVQWVENIERANNGAGITVLIDCSEAGLKNANLDVVKFAKFLFTYHYPKTLGYFLVYNLPWLLSAVWKLIKSWLPKYAVDIIKFVDKDTILEYIEISELPVEIGGKVPRDNPFSKQLQNLTTDEQIEKSS